MTVSEPTWETMRQLYLVHARESFAEWIGKLGAGEVSTKELQDFRIAVHRLRGTGSSYGYAWITEACALLDNEAAALLASRQLPSSETVAKWSRELEQLAARLPETPAI